jgi:hypothetical protein
MDATILEEISHRTPTEQGHQLEDLLKVATVPVAPAAVVAPPVMVTLAVKAAAAGAPHTELEGEPVVEAIAEAEATQTATSPVAHAAAPMPAARIEEVRCKKSPTAGDNDVFPAFSARLRNLLLLEKFKPMGITKYDAKQDPV